MLHASDVHPNSFSWNRSHFLLKASEVEKIKCTSSKVQKVVTLPTGKRNVYELCRWKITKNQKKARVGQIVNTAQRFHTGWQLGELRRQEHKHVSDQTYVNCDPADIPLGLIWLVNRMTSNERPITTSPWDRSITRSHKTCVLTRTRACVLTLESSLY